jgi:hypothetical protein
MCFLSNLSIIENINLYLEMKCNRRTILYKSDLMFKEYIREIREKTH